MKLFIIDGTKTTEEVRPSVKRIYKALAYLGGSGACLGLPDARLVYDRRNARLVSASASYVGGYTVENCRTPADAAIRQGHRETYPHLFAEADAARRAERR